MTPPSSIEQQPAGSGWERTADERATAVSTSTSRWRDAALALSIAHLTFIQSWHALLFERDFGYYNRIPVNRASVGALLINILILSVLLWLAGRVVRRLNQRPIWTLANLAIAAAALVPLNFCRTHFWHLTGVKFAAMLQEPLVIVAAFTVLLAALWFHRFAARTLMTLYLIISPMVLFTAGKSAWLIAQPPPAPRETLAPPSVPKAGSPRVVWILLDELDQRIAFDARPPGAAMPELSRLYQECLHATNAFPPGGSTMYSLPALTLGREVRTVRIAGAGELSFNGTGRWSEADTVFSQARKLGCSAALVGWYHPYGRLLGHSLERCQWGAYPPFEQERAFTLGGAMLNQACAVLSQLQQRRLQIELFRATEAASLAALTNSPAALTLLHLPVPHHPGIYNPERDKFTIWNYVRTDEYLDNLVLADRLFGKLRRAMEQANIWEDSWVVVSSDHWWRGAAAYDGKTDHRVPFIIKGPGKNESVLYGKRFNTLLTHFLLLSVLKGELTNASQLPPWLDAYRTEPPTGYKPDGEPF